MERQVFTFTTKGGFVEHLTACLARAEHTLRLFDPDFAIWDLGGSATDAMLRRFLKSGGRLQLVAHDGRTIERDAPRFLRLVKDYGHVIEVRRTSQSLRQLTDSFCIADELHIVRRFHSDHFRGEAVFDSPGDINTSLERFLTIWDESGPGLFANSTGL
ncbi:hypothetical protein NHH82_09455 [Oxalobacteraceae bacterium OTU3REALA1]|nr:hypothetical protein NHH82_09455 [Oxalobacteraceae bacterium OTU3REALA1]